MELRTRISEALIVAMKAHQSERVQLLRMVNSAIKDRDIAARGEGAESPVGESAVLALLGKLVKQRQESARAFRDGGRAELAAKEEAEISVIEEFLPRQMSADQVAAAIDRAVAELGATTLKDMGRVMALLKERHTGEIDFGAAGPLVRGKLG